jgi:hypothetical protein
MNIDRVSPRPYQPTAQRRVTFNPVVQVKTFTSSDPIVATRPTLHASRLESVLKTRAPQDKKVRLEPPEKPPPRSPYLTPETAPKKVGRLMAWCAIGSLLLIPAFGPGALVITGICVIISTIYFMRHERLINQGNYYEAQHESHFASTNRSLRDRSSYEINAVSYTPHNPNKYR